jgi:DNA-binding NtrC family response regulator
MGLMLMTAYRSSEYRRKADELGVIDFIEKPFAISVLAETIDRFFSQRVPVLR